MTPERAQPRGRAERPRPDRALPHGVHLGRRDDRDRRCSSAATSSPTRTSSCRAGCRCSGTDYFTLKADFRTAQAVTPGQGQAVTIAGAKIGEIASVRPARRDRARDDEHRRPSTRATSTATRRCCCARRPQLKDMTVEVDPGTPERRASCRAATRCRSRRPRPTSTSTSSSRRWTRETRAYLQELLAGAGEGLKGNGKAFSATFKRFDPIARDAQQDRRAAAIAPREHRTRDPQLPAADRKRSATRTQQLAELVDASNAVFATFAEAGPERRRARCSCCPARWPRPKSGLGKLATASTWSGRRCTSCSRSPARSRPPRKPTRSLLQATTPIIKNEIRPFAREILPVVNADRAAAPRNSAKPSPSSRASFSVFNEFFNELAYNPGSQAGRLPVLPGLGQPRPQQRAQHGRRPRRARAHVWCT